MALLENIGRRGPTAMIVERIVATATETEATATVAIEIGGIGTANAIELGAGPVRQTTVADAHPVATAGVSRIHTR